MRQLLNLWKPGAAGAEWIEDVYHDSRFEQALPFLRFLAAVPVRDSRGGLCAIICVAGMEPRTHDATRLRQLRDLAALTSAEFDPQAIRRDAARGWRPQDQLLEKSIELAKFGEDLRQLHRLSTADYESIDHLFADYLATGSAILGLPTGVVSQVRGRYAAMRAVRSDSPSLRPGMTFDLSRVFCGAVVEQRVTVACASVRENPSLSDRPHYGPARPGCYIGAPVVVDGDVYGVLSFSSANARRREFTAHEI
ncbi:MAG: GAF domain-containing protein, partial [Bryobacterales bacterium]|nr:GAF domain-containing protein [Bryobacterales bacterium]